MKHLVAEVETLTGSLTARKDRHLENALRDLDRAAVKQLVKIAEQARWLRLGQPDTLLWGALMGHLRWAASRLAEIGHSLVRVLDPSYRPPQPWATHCTREDTAQQLAGERARLHRKRPDRSAANDPERVLAWILAALTVFATDEIVSLVADARDAVAAVSDARLDSLTRRQRRRFRAVRRRLDEGDIPSVELDEAPTSSESHWEVDVSTETVADPGERLVETVRVRTEGRHALFVSNRTDPALRDRLERAFGLTLDWCVADPRKLHAAKQRIEQGNYRFVIAATGFMSHKDDRKLALACRSHDTTYVRAYRGRTLATAKALARELGVEPADHEADAPAAADRAAAR